MSVPEYQVLGGLWGNRLLQNFQFESPKMKLREFVRVPTVSEWAKFDLNLKGWSSDAIANSRAFDYFQPSIARTPRNFENSQRLSNFAELRTNNIAGSSKQ